MESFWGRMLLRIAEKEMKLVSHEKYGVKIIWVLDSYREEQSVV